MADVIHTYVSANGWPATWIRTI